MFANNAQWPQLPPGAVSQLAGALQNTGGVATAMPLNPYGGLMRAGRPAPHGPVMMPQPANPLSSAMGMGQQPLDPTGTGGWNPEGPHVVPTPFTQPGPLMGGPPTAPNMTPPTPGGVPQPRMQIGSSMYPGSPMINQGRDSLIAALRGQRPGTQYA